MVFATFPTPMVSIKSTCKHLKHAVASEVHNMACVRLERADKKQWALHQKTKLNLVKNLCYVYKGKLQDVFAMFGPHPYR